MGLIQEAVPSSVELHVAKNDLKRHSSPSLPPPLLSQHIHISAHSVLKHTQRRYTVALFFCQEATWRLFFAVDSDSVTHIAVCEHARSCRASVEGEQ